MKAKGIIIIAVFALIFAGAASYMVMVFLEEHGQKISDAPPLRPVVVSAADLSFGKTLAKEDLLVVRYPEESVPKGAVSEIDSLIGQTTKVFLAKNEPVLVSKLSSIGGGLSLLIEPTKRAASIQVDKVSGVSGFVLPGDRVDVIAVVKPTSSSTDAKAKTILQNVEVLAAGEKTEQRGKDPITVQAVTLLLDQEGAEKIALAANEGKLHLALRNPNDNALAEESSGISRSSLLGAKQQPAPRPRVRRASPPKQVAAPPVPDSLTIIRGTDASKQEPVMKSADDKEKGSE